MKSNVDLTENRDFQKNKLLSIKDILNYKEFPWAKINLDKKIKKSNSEQKEIFFTGSREERYYKNLYCKLTDNEICDCCGKQLNKPWYKHITYGLCKACNDAQQTFFVGKFPWNNKQRS